jgi:preprotein translocase subunit SecA
LVSRAFASAQSQVEGQNFEIRKNVLKYDDVLNRQREVIYAERRRVLEGEDLHDQVRMFLDDVVAGYVQGATSEGFAEEWDLEQLWLALGSLYPVGISIDEVVEEAGGREGLTADMLLAELRSDAEHAYEERERTLGAEVMRELERRVVLSVLDRKWREHLYEMDYLQEGIGLRAMAQRDPLVEYQREGFQLFTAMNEAIKEESVGYVFNLEVEVEPAPVAEPEVGIDAEEAAGEDHPHIVAKGLQPPSRPAQLQYTAPSVDGEGGVEVRAEESDGVPQPARDGAADGSRADRRTAARNAKKARRR